MRPDYSLLDDPFWNALQTTQKPFAKGTAGINKFPARVLPFVGLKQYGVNTLHEIEPFLEEGEEVYIRDAFDSFPANWVITHRLPVMQMVCTKPPVVDANKAEITRLGADDYAELFELVDLVQPGYFRRDTHLLGKYYGIREEGKLVAVAGERLKIEGFVEVSGVCTLPGHTGKGLAQQLICLLCNEIFDDGDIPFLHVLATNARAIKLYEYLNFEKRMDFPLIKAKVRE